MEIPMKTSVLFLVLSSLFSLSAHADFHLSQDAVNALIAVSHCPKEFAQLSSQGRLTSAIYDSSSEDVNSTVLFFGTIPSPLVPPAPIGQLLIKQTFEKNPGPVPADGSAMRESWSCEQRAVR